MFRHRYGGWCLRITSVSCPTASLATPSSSLRHRGSTLIVAHAFLNFIFIFFYFNLGLVRLLLQLIQCSSFRLPNFIQQLLLFRAKFRLCMLWQPVILHRYSTCCEVLDVKSTFQFLLPLCTFKCSKILSGLIRVGLGNMVEKLQVIFPFFVRLLLISFFIVT